MYKDITIDSTNINRCVSTFQPCADTSDACEESCTATDPQSNTATVESCEEIEDPLNENRLPISETCLQALTPDYPVIDEENQKTSSLGNEIYSIAPGENKHPVSLMTDIHCEELAFPTLFPKGRFGFTAKREIKLIPVKYFNARLLLYSGRFATNSEYLFFAQFIIEQKKVSDNVNIASLWKSNEANLHNDNAIYESFIDTFLKTKKPNRPAYKILVSKKQKRPITAQRKWVTDCMLEIQENIDWKTVYRK